MSAIDISNRKSQASWRAYWSLCKPRVVSLIVFTALVGMFLASPGMVPLDILLAATLGIGLAAASGAAFNQIAERDIDGIMRRTKWRPLPNGQLADFQAITFASSLLIVSMALLIIWVNVLTAVLTFVSMVGYSLIYTTYLKPNTPMNIVIGGAAGATPPLLGWCAVTGEVGVEAFVLFLIIFLWTPPHFWALAIHRIDDYAKAKIPMLPVTHGIAYTKRQILYYTILLVVVSFLPVAIGMSGLVYLGGATFLALGFISKAIVLRQPNAVRKGLALQAFTYSIFYLAALFTLLLIDHYLPKIPGIVV